MCLALDPEDASVLRVVQSQFAELSCQKTWAECHSTDEGALIERIEGVIILS